MKKVLISFVILANLMFAKEPVVLTFHHFLSPSAPPHTKVFEPWVKEVEKLSKGKIKIELFPAMTMGGKPNELYKQVRDGTADIVFTIAGYSPGVFTRSEVFELPTMQAENSLKTALAIRENFDLIKDDYKDVKPLLIAVAGEYFLNTVNKKVQSLADLKGLKIRAQSRTAAWYIEALGAEPVGMPFPDVPQALSKHAIDGANSPMEMFPSYKIHQFTKYSIQIDRGGGFGNSVAVILMNKSRFNSLPKDLQEIIEKSAGLNLINKYGNLMIDQEQIGIDLQVSSGGEMVKIDKKNSDDFRKIGDQVALKWADEMKQKGIDGEKIINQVKASISK